MDFELNKSQKEIQKAAREFAKGEFDKDLALELDRKHEFPFKIWEKACFARGIRPSARRSFWPVSHLSVCCVLEASN